MSEEAPRNFPAAYVASAIVGMFILGLLMIAIWEPAVGGATLLIAAVVFFLAHKDLKTQEKQNQSADWHNLNISRLMGIQLASVMLGIFSVMCMLQNSARPFLIILTGLLAGLFLVYIILTKHSPHDKSAIGWMAGGATSPDQKSD